MRYGSVCSGIESATAAWHPLGWEPAFFAEIAAFPSAVLKHHYPNVPNHGDFTTIQSGDYGAIDLLVGGTPCQDFSVAGLRAGINGGRGALTVEFARLAGRLRPEWVVWENVPGVLSADGGRAFGIFLGLLGQFGYQCAWRILDAQHFGVPQRRRRVFVVGHLGDWRRAAAVLFERHSLSGHPAPRRAARQSATYDTEPCLAASGRGFERPGDNRGQDCLVASTGDISHCLNAGGMGRQDYERETLIATAPTLTSNGDAHSGYRDEHGLVPIAVRTAQTSANGHGVSVDPAHTLGGANGQAVAMNLRGRDGGAMPELSDVASLRAADGGSSRSYVMYEQEDQYASTYEADAASVLRTLRNAVGAQAVAEWGSRILDSLQSPEVLRPWLHGESLRRSSSDFRSFVDDCTSPRSEAVPEGELRTVWMLGPNGRTSQGRGLAKQLAYQLGKTLPQLPSARAQGQSGLMAVRRLTPRECERLMGFPDDYTLVPFRKKPAADGPRYRALGNSKAVPVVRWIGERIKAVDAL